MREVGGGTPFSSWSSHYGDSSSDKKTLPKDRCCCAIWCRQRRMRFQAWAERLGLQYGDANLELEFLSTALNSTGIRVLGAMLALVVFGAYVAFLTNNNVLKNDDNYVTFYDDFDNAVTIASQVLLSLGAGFASVAWFATTCLKQKPRALVSMTQLGGNVFVLSLIFFVPYALYDSQESASHFLGSLDLFLSKLDNQSGTTCANATVVLAYNQTCYNDTSVDDDRCTTFASLVLYSRLFGFVYESFMKKLIFAYVCMVVTTVFSFFPARLGFFVVGIITMILLMITSQFTADKTLTNLNGSFTAAVTCNPVLGTVTAGFFTEITIAIVATAAALTLQMTSRSRLKRELFFWTKSLDGEMVALQNEADPFRQQTLQRWIDDAKQQAKAPRADTSDSDASVSLPTEHESSVSTPRSQSPSTRSGGSGALNYWDIPTQDLEIQRRVAAGAAGTVWQAAYKGRRVAAKQLTALSDLTAVDEALGDLINEVAILGQLEHPNVVRLLGLCKTYEDGILKVFIVQEWCDRNLRVYLRESFYTREVKKHLSEYSDSKSIALGLACEL